MTSLDESLRLASEAFDNYDYKAALEEYKRALDLVNKEGKSYHNDKKRADILLHIVDALDKDGQWLDALMYLDTIINLARTKKNHRLEMKANLMAGKNLTKRGLWKEANKRFQTTLELGVRSKALPIVAECQYGLAYISWRTGDMERAKICVDITLRMAKENEHSRHLTGQALVLLATVYDNMGRTDESIEKFGEAIRFLEEDENLNELARAYNNLGEVYKGLEDYKTATDQYIKCISVCQRSNDKHTEAYGDINAAECMAKSEQVAEARENVSLAEGILAALDDPYAIAYTHYIRGLIESHNEELDVTEKEFNIAIEDLTKLDAPYDVGIACYEFAKVLGSRGKMDQALGLFKKARDKFRQSDSEHYLKKVEDKIKDITAA